MPMTLGELVFTVALCLFLGICIALFLILVMHFLMPKRVLKKYFKPPFFRELECKLFTGIPYSPMRTVMFMTVLAFPGKGKKRKLT
jgi:hypothetical protein